MKTFDTVLSRIGFLLIAIVVGAAPWMFGAWEMWWFWPFAFLLFLATLVLAVRGAIWSATPVPSPTKPDRSVQLLILTTLPFLAYGLVRFLQADVFMDAERSFLLFLTPVLLGVHIVCGFNSAQRRSLFDLLALNLGLLGLYGLVNHWATGSRLVLWRGGFEQYFLDGRASGSYFCPDHFAGIMELAVCLGLGWLSARGVEWRRKGLGAALAAIGVAGVVFSKSRGGGMTLIVIAGAALIWGMGQWPQSRRWFFRYCAACLLVIAATVFWHSSHPYVTRFKNYGAWRRIDQIGEPEGWASIQEDILATSRGRMIAGALRAWRSEPVRGIGPGMHQHVWFHFGPTPDGDRAAGQWPSQPNTNFHSYEVHSDWVQLLQEYGAVGFVLFLVPALFLFGLLDRGLQRESERRRRYGWNSLPEETHERRLAGLLAWGAMAFHSLGDFNLQMPATTWLLAALLALPLADGLPQRSRRRRRGEPA